MYLIYHIKSNLSLYLVFFSWALVGQFAPATVAMGWALFTFLLIVRTNNLSQMLLTTLGMLILSDSRVNMMAFAATAKIGAVVILFFYIVTNYKEFRGLRRELIISFSPFLGYAVLASFWSEEPITAFQKSISYALIFFIIPIFFQRAVKQNSKLGNDVVSFLTIVLFLGLVGFYVSFDFGALAGRYRGLLGNPNGLGILLTLSGPIYFLLKKSGNLLDIDFKSELLFGAVFIISLALTGSRSSLFALLIFLVFVRLRYFTNAFGLVAFVLILVGYEMMFSSLPKVAEFFGLQEYFRIDTLGEGSGRFIAWDFAWQQIQNVFILGGGFGHTEIIFKKFFWELSALGHQGNAHNSYLTLWLDTGIVGVALFVYGLVKTILISLRRSSYTLPLIYTVLFSANFESWLAASLNPFTSLFLVAITITMLSSDDIGVAAEEPPIKEVLV